MYKKSVLVGTMTTEEAKKKGIVPEDKMLLVGDIGGGGADINVVQEAGDSTTDVMSQKAVTDSLSPKVVSWSRILEMGYETVGNWALDNMEVGETVTILAEHTYGTPEQDVVWIDSEEEGATTKLTDNENHFEWSLTFSYRTERSWSPQSQRNLEMLAVFDVRHKEGPLEQIVCSTNRIGDRNWYISYADLPVLLSSVQDMMTYSDRWGESSGVLSAKSGSDVSLVLQAAVNIEGLTEPEPIMWSGYSSTLIEAQAVAHGGEWYGNFTITNGFDFDAMEEGATYYFYFKDHNGLPMNFATEEWGSFKTFYFNYEHDGEQKQVAISSEMYNDNGTPKGVAFSTGYGKLSAAKKFSSGEVHFIPEIGEVSGYQTRTIMSIGDMTALETEHKTDLVSAINELNQKLGNIESALANLTSGEGV